MRKSMLDVHREAQRQILADYAQGMEEGGILQAESRAMYRAWCLMSDGVIDGFTALAMVEEAKEPKGD